MAAFFVTGSGTGVGKTLVTAALAWQLRRTGREVRVLKPVITGFDPLDPAETDSAILLECLDREVTDRAIGEISPWQYSAPLSPDMAAAREGTAINFPRLVAFCRGALAEAERDGAILLIEGVGGVMVPLTRTETVADWMAGLGLPAVVVGGSYLGALSHTLTALRALAAHGVETRAVVVSDTAGSTVPLDDTTETIRRFAHDALVLALPRIAGAGKAWREAPDLTAVFGR